MFYSVLGLTSVNAEELRETILEATLNNDAETGGADFVQHRDYMLKRK